MRGTLWMLAGACFFACMWGLIRLASHELNSMVIVLYRFLLGAILILLIHHRRLPSIFDTSHIAIHIRRNIISIFAVHLLFYAISAAPLPNVLAINYAQPLFITIGAVLFLGERIRIRRILALIAGFSGVLLVLRPGSVPMTPGIMAALASAVVSAMAYVQIKQLTAVDSSDTVVAWSFVLPVPIVFLTALPFWQWPSAHAWLILCALSAFAYGGQACMTRALKIAEMTAVMPYDFLRFVLVTLISISFFHERFDIYTVIGGAVIFASAVYLAYRESVAARQKG